jgi:DNA modification methylase
MRYLKGYVFWNLSYNMKSRWEFIEIFYRIIHETDLQFLEKITWDKGHGLPINSPKGLTREYEQILVAGDEDTIQKEISFAVIGNNTDKVIFRKNGYKGLTNYWRISTEKTQTEEHRAAFPLELPMRAIRLMTDEGDLIFDPFGGIGTTLIAAEKTKRRCFMVELDPIYCSFIIERWENVTGKKAVKI